MDIKRAAAVTGGLMLAGAVAGGVVGIAMGVFLMASAARDGLELGAGSLPRAGVAGAVVGAVLGPLAAWLLMRHVPLGLAIGGTALGTLAGAVAGLFTSDSFRSLEFSLIGFVVSALALWIFTPRRTAVPRGPSS